MTDPATIFALASGAGAAGVAVVRVSGPRCWDVVKALTGDAPARARMAALRRLTEPATGEPLDDALVIFFQAPQSYTGEDVVEFHVHGGRAVVAALTTTLASLPGLRPAAPGEFTRRAFENGKLDLTAAEGVADLVAAETAAQRRQALRQLDGALGRLYDGWRTRLTRTLAHLEADIDFPDEDLPGGLAPAARAEVEALSTAIAAHLADGRRGERLRDGVSVAIVGAPNAGKSSLLNAIAGRDVAIVSARAGTTRDVIEVHLDLGGYPVVVADTAGLRETGDEVEAEGVRRAHARAGVADLKVAVFDGTQPPDAATLALVDADTIPVWNKLDVMGWTPPVVADQPALRVSAATGEGLDALLARLGDAVAARAGLGEAPALTQARHRAALEETREALARALTATLPELAAEDVRLAVRALGRITGRVDVEDLLDVIFREFCIGK